MEEPQSPFHPNEVIMMMARVDERTTALLTEVRSLKETTVTKAEFSPVKNLVYGLVAVIMSSVIVALMAVVLKS